MRSDPTRQKKRALERGEADRRKAGQGCKADTSRDLAKAA
jgi:hypothetical protein